jgi:hypothetical protein
LSRRLRVRIFFIRGERDDIDRRADGWVGVTNELFV